MDTDAPSPERTSRAELKSAAMDLKPYLGSMESLLRTFIEISPFELTFSVRKTAAPADDPEAPEYLVEFSGPDADLLLEKHATLLQALEHLVLKAIRLDEDHFRRISFDCLDWRRSRLDELRLIAQMAAERVIETGDSFSLNPMNSRERRLIHLALRDRPEVRTQSEGVGPERKVVIFPAK